MTRDYKTEFHVILIFFVAYIILSLFLIAVSAATNMEEIRRLKAENATLKEENTHLVGMLHKELQK